MWLLGQVPTWVDMYAKTLWFFLGNLSVGLRIRLNTDSRLQGCLVFPYWIPNWQDQQW